jgi:hypothetical protein
VGSHPDCACPWLSVGPPLVSARVQHSNCTCGLRPPLLEARGQPHRLRLLLVDCAPPHLVSARVQLFQLRLMFSGSGGSGAASLTAHNVYCRWITAYPSVAARVQPLQPRIMLVYCGFFGGFPFGGGSGAAATAARTAG